MVIECRLRLVMAHEDPNKPTTEGDILSAVVCICGPIEHEIWSMGLWSAIRLRITGLVSSPLSQTSFAWRQPAFMNISKST